MSSSLLRKLLIEPGVRWWQGFRACLPASLRRKLLLEKAPWILDVLESGSARLQREIKGRMHEFDLISLDNNKLDSIVVTQIRKSGAPVHLLLPASWVLVRNAAMPAAAKENLRQVLSFEMDRLTPFSSDQVCFDFQLEDQGQNPDTLAVRLALVPTVRISAWLELLQRDRISLNVVRAKEIWPDANFLPPEKRPRPDALKILVKATPAGILVLLLTASLALPLWQKKQIAVELGGRETDLRKKADAVIRIREQIDAEQKRLAGIASAWKQEPPVLDVLKVLTDLLPDDSSLQQLDMKDSTVTLRGTSRNASTLLKAIEDSEGFSEAKFMSSVVQQRGEEQFHLSAKIESPFSQLMPTTVSDTPVAPTPTPVSEAKKAGSAGDLSQANSLPAPVPAPTADKQPPAAKKMDPNATPKRGADQNHKQQRQRLTSGAG